MAWTYSDYVTLSGTARLTRLQLHIQEVSDCITENVQVTGRGVDTNPLNTYLKALKDEEIKLGGQSIARGDRRSRVNRIDHREPQGVD